MTEYITLEHLLSDLDHNDSHTSFLHLTEDKIETTPEADSSAKQDVEQLEDRLRELSTLIKARDRELDELYQDQSLTPVRARDIDTHFQSLQQENTQLRALAGLKVEAERLRAELGIVTQSTQGYEQKLTEITSKLATLKAEDSASFLGDSEKLTDLTKKISLFQHANGDLQEQVERAKEALREVQEENEGLKGKVIPHLKRQIVECEGKRNSLRERTEDIKRSLAASAKCRLAAGIWTSPKGERKGRPASKLSPKASPRVSPRPLGDERGKSPKPGGSEYVPSFLRSKRPVTLLAKKRAAK
jgi:hypothetical protein